MLFAAGAAPGLGLAWDWQQDALGADPLNRLIHDTGWWAFNWLLAALAVTPLRRLSVTIARWVDRRFGRRMSDWNALIRHRRQLGLWAFAYGSAHLMLYVELDAGSLAEAWTDIGERPFIALGLAAWCLMLPLAATSSAWAIRRLKKRWKSLHRLMYPLAVLAVVHDLLQAKGGLSLDGQAVVCAVLLGARVLGWWLGDRQDAAEHARQTAAQRHDRSQPGR